MKNFFAALPLLYHLQIITYSLHRYHFWLSKRCNFFFFQSYFCMLSSTFNFFIDILFRIIIVCKCCTTFNVSLLLFNDRWICAVSLCPRVSVFFPKPCCVYILRLPLRGALPNECSRNVQKFLEKIYLWVN